MKTLHPQSGGPVNTVGDHVLATLPKISLHDHLEGGLRASTVLELSLAGGLRLPITQSGDTDADTEALASWFLSRSMTDSLVDYLESFSITSAVLQSAPNLRRVAREYVLDLAADGIIYGEVRWAPEMNRESGLTVDEAVDAVADGVTEGISEARANGHDIDVRLLLCAMRNADNSVEVVENAMRRAGGRVVGFDIAGPENGFAPSQHRAAFDLAADALLPVTVHAGEAAGVASIRSALVDGRALRLGHGIRIAQDIDVEERGEATLGPVAQWVLDRGIVLETSPTSNSHTGAFSWRGQAMTDHPFDLLHRLGFAVTVNTDNRLMSRTSLTNELVALSAAFGYDLDDHETFQQTAAEGAFITAEERRQLADRVAEGFRAARTAVRAALPPHSPTPERNPS